MTEFNFPKISYKLAENNPDMLDAIGASINKNLLITGCAGSGKSIVAILRAARILKELKKEKIIFFTYGILIKEFLKKAIHDFPSQKIQAIYDWCTFQFNSEKYWDKNKEEIFSDFEKYVKKHGKFQAVIIDEGQDLPEYFYKAVRIISEHITVCADDSQILYPENSTKERDIKEILNSDQRVLTRNYRNTKEIYNFAKYFIKEDERLCQSNYEPTNSNKKSLPVIIKTKNIEEESSGILKILNDYKVIGNIGIFVKNSADVNELDAFLGNNNIEHSKYSYGIKKLDIKSPFITTYKSAKGLEFDLVILPRFHEENMNSEIIAGSPTCTGKDLFVAMTRTKKKLFMICHKKMPLQFNEIPDIFYEIKSF